MHSSTDHGLTTEQRTHVLLAEHSALYALAEFRMASLDRRVPAVGAALVAFIGGTPAVPEPTALLLLAVVPISLIWFLRTTINHARSFEDAIRRIEQIERAVNRLAGSELITFQSTHPSRGRAVGGRTGTETVLAALLASAVLLMACGVFAAEILGWGESLAGYGVFLSLIVAHHGFVTFRWAVYRYTGSREAIVSDGA